MSAILAKPTASSLMGATGHAARVEREPGLERESSSTRRGLRSYGQPHHAGAPVVGIQADAMELPIRSESVDVAFAFHMLYHVPEIPVVVTDRHTDH